MTEPAFRVKVADIRFSATPEGRLVRLEGGRQAEIVPVPGGSYRVFMDDRVLTAYPVSHDAATKTMVLATEGFTFEVQLQNRLDQVLDRFGLAGGATAKAADLKAPMPGLVHKVLVQPGQAVEKGTPLLVLVAMKMENLIKAQAPGTVTKVLVQEGDKVEKGAVLVGF